MSNGLATDPSKRPDRAQVAVLLATYNGERFIDAQIASLQRNATPFTLHWIDDNSTDNTREAVRRAAAKSAISLREWHHPEHLGVPATFFRLLECVDAEFYFFCDQDDIWQPGKIDVAVESLRAEVHSPALCFSDPLMFYDDEPEVFQRISDVLDIDTQTALQDSRSLMSGPPAGPTIGFNRALRDIFISHKEIAKQHAIMHTWWMYLIAVASGTARMLSDVPTALYRRHANNVTGFYFGRRSQGGIRQIAASWRTQQWMRRGISRQANGFILAANTLPGGAKLERLLAIARIVATLNLRQSPVRAASPGQVRRHVDEQATRTLACSRVPLLGCKCLNPNHLPGTKQSMNEQRHSQVAILLATHNGSRFIGPQIESLTEMQLHLHFTGSTINRAMERGMPSRPRPRAMESGCGSGSNHNARDSRAPSFNCWSLSRRIYICSAIRTICGNRAR